MPSIIRSLLLAALVLPAFSLDIGQLDGLWAGDGEATWAEMVKLPTFSEMPAEELEQIKPLVLAQFGELRIRIAKGVAVAIGADGVEQDAISFADWTSTGETTATAVVPDPEAAADQAPEEGAMHFTFELPDATTLRIFGQGSVIILHPAATEAVPAAVEPGEVAPVEAPAGN